MGLWLLLCLARQALAGPFGTLPFALPVDLLEFGDELVLDQATGGLSYVKARAEPLFDPEAAAAEALPIGLIGVGDELVLDEATEGFAYVARAQPLDSQAASSWQPAPSPGLWQPAPSPSPPAPGPEEQPPPAEEEPPQPGREGWPPLAMEWPEGWRGQTPEQLELAQQPVRAVWHPEKAEKAAAYTGEHYWHSSRGSVCPGGALSPHVAPLARPELLRWRWEHPAHKWATILTGISIDDRLNLYLTCFDGVRKFSVEGQCLWEWNTLPSWSVDAACLLKGGLYGCLCTGEVYAVDIEDGSLIWLTKVSYAISQDDGFVAAHDRHVIVAGDAHEGDSGSKTVMGLAVADGEVLWKFSPDMLVWNFGASFPGDGSIVFQDFNGRAYRLALADGALLWKAGGVERSWTDGTLTLGPNKVVYAVGVLQQGGNFGPGTLTAYRLEDGVQLWQQFPRQPPNNAPAVGPLRPGARLSVVQPFGSQCTLDVPIGVIVYDAETGERQWEFYGPSLQRREPLKHSFQAADPQGEPVRLFFGVRGQSAPNPWGAPSIGADGTIYLGNQDGQFYCLRQSDEPARSSFRYRGHWQGLCHAGKGHSVELCAFDTSACFGGSSGPALAPGLLAFASIDGLYVFRDPAAGADPQ